MRKLLPALLVLVNATWAVGESIYVGPTLDACDADAKKFNYKESELARCVGSIKGAEQLKQVITKEGEYTLAEFEDGADYSVVIVAMKVKTGKYLIQNNSFSNGTTTVLDVDIREVKVNRMSAYIYIAGEMVDSTRPVKKAKDIYKQFLEVIK